MISKIDELQIDGNRIYKCLTYTNISDYTITFSLILVSEATVFKNSPKTVFAVTLKPLGNLKKTHQGQSTGRDF